MTRRQQKVLLWALGVGTFLLCWLLLTLLILMAQEAVSNEEFHFLPIGSCSALCCSLGRALPLLEQLNRIHTRAGASNCWWATSMAICRPNERPISRLVFGM